MIGIVRKLIFKQILKFDIFTLMKLLILIIFLIPNIVFAGPMKMIGEKGKPSEVKGLSLLRCTTITMNLQK